MLAGGVPFVACWLKGSEHVFGIRPNAVVGVGFGKGDLARLIDDEGRGDGKAPGVGALIAIDEGNVDHDGAVVVLHGFGNSVGDAKGVCENRASVREEGIGEVMVLDGEVVLAWELGGNRDEQRSLFADLAKGCLPRF